MKIYVNGLGRAGKHHRAAFTLIEMIGVLAVIAILASMLLPKVFSAINDARVNSTAVATESVKAAAASHYGKFGQFDMLQGTINIYTASNITTGVFPGYDVNVLMAEGLMDKPFSAKIAGGDPSNNSSIQLLKATAATPIGNNGTGYKLDGVNNATATASYVLEAVLNNVSQSDAKDLNDRIDGTALGTPLGQADTAGRVEYSLPNGNGPVTVYIYLTHR
jgi:prepilin-type N-terminal cleavage/methylation domain-containing protein